MIILGIDPGTATTGYGIISSKKSPRRDHLVEVIDFGCIFTSPSSSVGGRLKTIHSEVCALIKKHKPGIVSIESLYFFKNLKTALPVSQAKGVILLAAAEKNIPTCEFTPLQVKMTVVGYGRAEKKQVQEMTKQLLDLSGFNLKENGRKNDDAFDALGVALCALFNGRSLVF